MTDSERINTVTLATKVVLCFFSMIFVAFHFPGYNSKSELWLKDWIFYSYLWSSLILCLAFVFKKKKVILNDYLRHNIVVIIFLIVSCIYWIVLFPLYFYDGETVLYLWLFGISLLLLFISSVSGILFLDETKYDNEINKKIIVRGKEIEAKKFSPFSYYNYNSFPYLKTPITAIGNSLGMFFFVVYLIGGGAVFGIIELLKRTVLFGTDISPYPIMLFVMGTPMVAFLGFIFYALIRHFKKWNKVIKTVKKEHGEFRLFINYDGRPYKELRPSE